MPSRCLSFRNGLGEIGF
ncbi:hypothetical protein LINPERPRIM_LOCUS16930 [Linum perenne]